MTHEQRVSLMREGARMVNNKLDDVTELTYIAYIYRRLEEINRKVSIEKSGVHIEIHPTPGDGETYRRIKDGSLKTLVQSLDEDSFKRIIHDGSSRIARRIADWYEEEELVEQRRVFSQFGHWLSSTQHELPMILVTISDGVWVKCNFDKLPFERLIMKHFTGNFSGDTLLMTLGQKEKPPESMSLVRRLLSITKEQSSQLYRGVAFVKRVDRSSLDHPWIDHVDAAFAVSLNSDSRVIITINKFNPCPELAKGQPWVIPMLSNELLT